MLLLGAFGTAAAEPRRVLLLHSFGPHFVPWIFFSGRFREELVKLSPEKIDLYEASLEAARFAGTEQQAPFVDYVRSLFADRKLDLIVTMGAPAARFALQFRPQFFPSTPLVLGAVEQRAIKEFALTTNETMVAGKLDFSKSVANILQVLPATTHIAWAMGASPLERFWAEQLRREVEPFTNKVTFEWFNDLSFEGMLNRAATLPPNSAIFYVDIRMDAVGIPLDQERALRRLREVANAPIFSYVDSYLGQGIVGGRLVSSLDVGRRIAEVAIRVLGGESPGDIKTPLIELGEPTYDWRELQYWNISEANLPAGSTVRFREPTVWQRYQWQITTALLALLVQSALLAWLLSERLGRRKAEAHSRTLGLEVMHLNRAAEAGALSASFAHDLGQPLLAIGLTADRAAKLLKDRPELGELKDALLDIAHANAHATDIIKQFGKLLKRRSDRDRQEADLNAVIADALSILTSEASRRQVLLTAEGGQKPLRVSADPVHLLQVVLNLATNAMDAMVDTPLDARRLTIRTALIGDTNAEVIVSDSGPGIRDLEKVFDTFYTTKEQGTGLGLSIARTIVETYGGKIWAENGADGGAVFHFIIPAAVYAQPLSYRIRRAARVVANRCKGKTAAR
ncbi:MAG: ATP-binding protein [Hyphomicrobiaceae bacterium]